MIAIIHQVQCTLGQKCASQFQGSNQSVGQPNPGGNPADSNSAKSDSFDTKPIEADLPPAINIGRFSEK